MESADIAKIPLFAQLTLDQCNDVAVVCKELELEAGTTLLREGDFGYALFAITEGTAEVAKNGEALRELQPGDCFGEIAILAGGTRTATIVAKTPMKVVAVMNRDMWRLEEQSPQLGATLRATVAERLAT
jgi:CRP-like cAMP-binding protein